MSGRVSARRVMLALALLFGVVLLAGGCAASRVTSPRLDVSLGSAFARLYVTQQHTLGASEPRRPDGRAICTRNNSAHKHSGAGDDWGCIVNYPYPDGHVQPVTYDVQVAPSGCYTATGPVQIVGQQRQRAASGATVTNPLFEFDGCFNTA